MYCQCFAVKMYCGSNCRCMSCYNIPSQEKSRAEAIRLILSRNPNAFDMKFASVGEAEPGTTGTPVEDKTLLHKTGCKCRKSGCTKKVRLYHDKKWIFLSSRLSDYLQIAVQFLCETVLRMLRWRCTLYVELSLCGV